MAGFITNSVELIQRILFDGRKTDELLVLKELVQNADDAKAKILEVGISEGLPGAEHPLLQGRALYVVNNGPFKASHARAVRSLGGSSKVEEEAAIGKFGIGLKSVFYLGEVFFYLCPSVDDDGSAQLPLAQVLNPWNNGPDTDNPRPEWDTFSVADRRRMRAHLDALGVTDGFAIWVPLRTQESTQLIDGELSVYQAYPGDDDELDRALFSQRVYSEIARMLPLMRHLRRVHFHAPRGPVTLDAGDSTRSQYPDVVGEHAFAGEVRGEGVPDLQFSAAEHLLTTGRIQQLRDSGHWPRRQVAGTSRQVEDKTRAHTAVALKRQADPRRDGAAGPPARLVIQWAVFLPLGERETIPIGGPADFHITLHGCFFITSDRRDILSWRDAPRTVAESSSQLQQQWNGELARKGTLPLLLPTLSAFARQLTADEAMLLTAGIKASQLWRMNQAELCTRGQWVLTVENGWQLMPPGTRLLAFPRLSGGQGGAWLPGWAEVQRRATLVDDGAPHLMAGMPAPWRADEVTALLGDLQPGDLDTAALGHLTTLLQTVAHLDNWPARRNWLARVLALDAKTLGANREALAALLQTAPTQQCFSLPKGIARHVRERLALLSTSVLVVPGEVNLEGQARLSWQDALTLLQSLAGQRGTTGAVTQVLNAVAEDERRQLRAAVSQLPLVEVRTLNSREQEPTFITPAEAFARVVARQLFRATDTTREWARVVEQAFRGGTPQYTEGAVLEALGGEIASFEPEDLLALLRQGLPFSGLEGRTTLLQELTRRNLVESHPALIRVTLHGHPNQLNRTEPLLVVRAAQPTLERLAGQLLAGRGEAWRVVPRALDELLNEPQRRLLQVEPLDPGAVAGMVDASSVAQVNAGAFSEDERLALLMDLPVSVARCLPFHPAQSGTLVALTPDTLMPGDGRLPAALTEKVTLLRPDQRWARLWAQLGVEILSPAQAIVRVLSSAAPSEQTLWLLDQLEGLEADALEAVRDKLAATTWLLDASGEYVVAPGDVLCLPELDDAVTRVLAEMESAYIDPNGLPQAVTSHRGFDRLRREGFLLTGVDAALALARVMADHPDHRYQTGQDQLDFEAWWRLFGQLDDAALPALAVLRPLQALDPAWARQVKGLLAGSLPDAALAPVLNHVADQHRRSLGDRDVLLRLHAELLAEVKKRELWRQLRPALQLRNMQNQWRRAGELCVQAEGVDGRDQLHQDHQRQLGDVITPENFPEAGVPNSPGTARVDVGMTRAAQDLEAYFAAWEGLVPGELIGAFLSLLGGDPAVEALARRMLHPRSLGTVRDIVEADATQRPHNVGSFAEWVALYRVTVLVSADDHLWVMSLTDEPLRVRRDTSRANVVVGRPEAGRIHGNVYVSPLHLNTLDLTRYSRKELTEALLAATRAVLRGMYFVREDHLDDLWKQLGESDQFDLLYTQDVIIQDSISYIRYQLSLPGQNPLNALFARWESARLLEAEEHHNRLVRRKGQAAEQIEGLRDELRDAFENEDSEVLPRLLEAVRRRVQDAQYLPTSVPFELLQNADDALEELQVMRQGGQVDDTFVVEIGADTLTFMHWGRAINQFALPGFNGEIHGFKGDLKKMLMLAASDKGASELQVTGKFGMGFKSVYLLADRPRVVSGRLAFDVLGGVYPRQMDAEQASLLRDGLARHGERRSGTAISLEVEAAAAGLALQEFRAWLPVLLVFTRQVKRVVDVTESGERVTSWQDVPLGEDGWRVGGVHPQQGALGRALVCQVPNGTLLFPLGARGLTPLPDEVPTLWVTAPTRSHARAGFAVNATFALDIGRAEVASRAPHNERLAVSLAEDLARALRTLHDRTADWPGFVQALALAADTTPQVFWLSVWQVLAERAPEPQGAFAGQLVHRMVWGSPQAGLWALLQEREVLPTGLNGDHDVLTSLGRATHELHGVAAREGVFSRLRESATLNLQYPPGTLVHEQVATRLRGLTNGQVNLPRLRLVDILRAEFGAHPEVTPDHARRLGQEYSRATLTTFGEEQAEVQDYLGTFRFQTLAGTFVPAHELILGLEGTQVGTDERLRAAFAPRARVLHAVYHDAADFVVLCRNGLRADARALAQWVSDARGIEAQRAVLRYLLEGELAASLANELAQAPETWLSDLLTHPAFRALTNDERHILAGRLQLGSRLDQLTRSSAPEPEDAQPVRQVEDPAQALQTLYDHWQEAAEDLTRSYEEAVYPAFMRSGGTLLPFGEDRKRWMTLLLLGTYQSLGRTTPQQNRDFLQGAERDGWLDVFASPEVNPVEWFEILDQFLSRAGGQEYYHWFSRFLATYQLSRHLDEYMAILSGMDRFTGPQPLSAVLNPSSSALFSGTGINVPDLHRALGIGRHFVLRELLRTGTIVTRHMDAEAFHPSAAVRRELAALGCPIQPQSWNPGDSRTIHSFLRTHLGEKRATFHGGFDLPFVLQVPVA
ncbi:sacsin N-terminal ATP-binding-like domain-containing protein [Deinococcus sp. QL22]|uniref:sacsin N-terminal ATP-binding-like domain-containing protein n=1 Tax=Deinococcus sp. QL22 TaxID=2939437 RepID=UPI0020171AB1|nr:hypothetical protein [Deinococcus sp. QL22]UQN06499.1 hypothetical protein M1R55_00855 [Deinococcus sp. QL22]